MKKVLLAIIIILAGYRSIAQQTDSCNFRISLLTCTPGNELYAVFGHTALRVIDANAGTDIVFNYGTFDFDDPNFLLKFTKGNLLYFVSVDPLNSFLEEYRYYKRGVTEQVLQLSCEEKEQFIAALFENAKPQNKYYRYDFSYDNCTTRLRDMLEKITGKELQTVNIIPDSNTTFRTLIHEYLDKGQQQWSKLGIDILLGSPLDKVVTNREAMFLPDYMMKAFDSATLNGQKLVTEKNQILPPAASSPGKSFFTPFVVFTILLALIIVLSLLKTQTAGFFKLFDPLFFLICGLLGAFLLFMWFGTLHQMAKYNFNLLWALPIHLIVAPFLLTRKQWVKRYFYSIALYYSGLLAAWYFLPQQMNPAILPVIGILLIRAAFICKKK